MKAIRFRTSKTYAFGLRTGTDTTTDPYAGFGGGWGYYADAETGLSLLGHRYYDTGTGRFINRDPLGYAGGADLYAYCGNNPVMDADPSGFCGGNAGNPLSDWYWGGMGGISDWASNDLLNGSDKNLGSTVGDYDAGKASAWDVAGAGAQFGANIAVNVVPGGGEARAAEVGTEVASHAAEDGVADLSRNAVKKDLVTFTDHSVRQMDKRGWSELDVAETLDNPSATVVTRDTRQIPRGSVPKDDPATVYYHPDRSGYIVVNDITNEIIQLSGREPGWKTPWPSPF